MSRLQKTTNTDLPEDGTKVKAMTYDSIEYDREAKEVTGTLTTRPSPFGTQCFVDGVQVNSDTVSPLSQGEDGKEGND